ncbi:DUF2235 domain-containing protein [Vibrio astriarenae]
MKNLFICCDGTWNAKDNRDDGELAPTNVRKIFNCLKPVPKEQLVHYQEGVGTGGLFDKVLGGMVGVGLSEDIKECYLWLCDKYQAKDTIALLGFSRGAYTARCLGGMITKLGIADFSQVADNQREELAETIYQCGYRNKDQSKNPRKYLVDKFGVKFHPRSNKVAFIGVWDTVGALGIPNDKYLLNLFDVVSKYSFHDVKLSENVQVARHAVAIDEKRGSFSPTLWESDNGTSDIKQVWFPGVHSDVGGGYKEKGLSDGALEWMIDELNGAIKAIYWDQAVLDQIAPNYQDELHDSHQGLMKVLLPAPRSIPQLSQSQYLSTSAIQRMAKPPNTQGRYLPTLTPTKTSPVSVDIYAHQPYHWTGIYLEKGKQYRFSATGAWKDAKIVCGPKGTNDGQFHISEALHVVGSLFGKLENAFNTLFHQDQDFSGTKRHENSPWFCLMGAVANGGNPQKDGTHAPLESFEIGDKARYQVKGSGGYLYCYPNDAWGFYGNNRGYVTLKVEVV